MRFPPEDDATLARLRELCLALPEAVEAGGVGNPSWKVRGKVFAADLIEESYRLTAPKRLVRLLEDEPG